MRCALAVILFSVFGSAQAAIVTYNFEALLSGGNHNGSIISGTLIIDDASARDYQYLEAETDDAVLFWEYNTPLGTLNSESSSTIAYHLYGISGVGTGAPTVDEWYVDLSLDSSGERLTLGALGIGDKSVEFDGSSGTGSYSISSAVPIPAAVWLFGSALAGLGWFRRKA